MRSLEEIIHINAQPDPDAYVLARRNREPLIELEAPKHFKFRDPVVYLRRGDSNEKTA